jgi:hypothetical protein
MSLDHLVNDDYGGLPKRASPPTILKIKEIRDIIYGSLKDMNLFDLDQPIIEIVSASGNGNWTIRHAVEGVQIFGGIGSGKTSGSGRMLTRREANMARLLPLDGA